MVWSIKSLLEPHERSNNNVISLLIDFDRINRSQSSIIESWLMQLSIRKLQSR